ncbi:MAG: rod shape-determining protein MreC [Spirochaetia bacterium]|nr:rod shape-determining protein MreC [Spirochaetia bacterium]MBQ3713654.1 rod shape-determining protein MreC [Spirochaetia bacterium]MBQ6673883.1 rod shape-determining protein MreC [Spirochaetia bacterium]
MFKGISFQKHKKDFITLFVLVSLSIGMLVYTAFSDISFRPKQVGLDFFSLFQRGIVGTGKFFSQTLNSISELRNLKKEYDSLLEDYAEYQQIKQDYDHLAQENSLLKDQLGYMKEEGIAKIPAKVIGGNTGNFFRSMVINQGSNKGIKKDMPVIAYVDGYQSLVGKVMEVSAYSAVVKPITDSSLYVPAVLQKYRYRGLVNGLVMDFVSREASSRIGYGDLVVTSGFNGSYPENIYIGKVKSISSKEYETSLRLEIEPFVDFFRLEYVFVLDQGRSE